MFQFVQKGKENPMSWLINGLVFLYFLTVLALPKGYSYAPIALAVIGIIYLFLYLFKFKRKLMLTKEDKGIIFAFIFYFSTFVFSIIFHKDGLRDLDNPSRALLFLPLLLLFREFPISLKVILSAIPIGAALSGIVALYQKFYLNIYFPFPSLMSIQAGDIAVALGSLSLAVAFYWFIKRSYLIASFSLLGTLLSFSASALSGARGGWISLPIIFFAVLYFYRQYLNKKIVLFITLLLTLLVSAIIVTPKFNVVSRYELAKRDISLYLEKKEKSTSVGARFDMWENALLGAKEKPIFGWGTRGYSTFRERQVKAGTMAPSSARFGHAHNDYFDTLVKKGIIGLLAFLGIFIVPFYSLLKTRNNVSLEQQLVKTLGVVHLSSVAVFSLTQGFFSHHSGIMFFSFLAILFFSLNQNKV